MPHPICQTIVCRTEARFAIADECFRNIKSSYFTHFLKLHFTLRFSGTMADCKQSISTFFLRPGSCPNLLPYPLLCLSLTTILFSSGIWKFCDWVLPFLITINHHTSVETRQLSGAVLICTTTSVRNTRCRRRCGRHFILFLFLLPLPLLTN